MKTTDVLGCVGSATLILMAALWIPLLGPFISLLTPLPFLYYTTKLGVGHGVKLLALALGSVGLLGHWTGHPQAILFAIEFSLLGLLLSELFRKGLSVGKTVVSATAFLLMLGFGFLLYGALRRGMGPWELIRAYLGENLRATFRAYEEMGVVSDNGEAFRQYGQPIIDALLTIFPALMIVGTGFVAWLNVILARPLFRATHLAFPEHFRMERWRAPENLVWVLLASGFALFFTSGGIQFVAINTMIVVTAVYVFHGLSIVVYFLDKYHVPVWVRIGLYLVIVVQQLFLVVLALAGLFDQWINFRRIPWQSNNDLGEEGE